MAEKAEKAERRNDSTSKQSSIGDSSRQAEERKRLKILSRPGSRYFVKILTLQGFLARWKGEYFDEIPTSHAFTYLQTKFLFMKSLATILLVLLFPAFVICQENVSQFYPGFSVTPQVSYLRQPDPEGNRKPKSGVTLDAILAKALSDNFHLGTGLSFQHATIRQQGEDRGWPSEVEDGEYKPAKDDFNDYQATYSAIGIPVKAQLYLGKNTNRFAVTGIFRFNYLVSIDHEYISKEPGVPQATIRDADLFGIEARKAHFQIGTGIGYEFGLGKGHRLLIGPNVEYSLTDFVKSENSLNEEFSGSKTLLIGFQVNYRRQRE